MNRFAISEPIAKAAAMAPKTRNVSMSAGIGLLLRLAGVLENPTP